MAKKNFTPNMQEFYNQTVKHLTTALDLLENEKATAMVTPETYIDLAYQSAVTVNYYAKDMLNDSELVALEALKKPALDYSTWLLNRDLTSATPAGWAIAQIAATVDVSAIRQQLISNIRVWMNA